MSYVPGYDYDVFVSYASVDNDPIPTADRGWVDTLIQIVTSGSGLAGKLGRREAFTWWIDKQHLRGNNEADSHIPEQVKRSALLLVVLSPGYVASTFCKLELQTFLDSVGSSAERVFVVYREPVVEQRHALPETLRSLRKYEFWERDANNRPRILGWPQPIYSNPADRTYYQRVEDVCKEIADKLDELKRSVAPAEAIGEAKKISRVAATSGERGPAVLLAETTDDMVRKRDEARRYLDQAGIAVLPSGSYYGLSANEYERALESDLANCTAFVQLLGPELGRSLPDVPDGFGWLQHNVAKRLQRPILQWCNLDLSDLRAVADPKQRRLLQNADAMPFEDFKQKIVQSVLEGKPKAARTSFVFINCDSVDTQEADDIGNHLGANVDWERPPFEEKPKARVLQESIESSLVDCDGLLIVHGKSPVGWVRSQLQLYRKLRQRRAKEPRVLAVVQSGHAPELKGFGLAGLKIIGVDDLSRVIKPALAP